MLTADKVINLLDETSARLIRSNEVLGDTSKALAEMSACVQEAIDSFKRISDHPEATKAIRLLCIDALLDMSNAAKKISNHNQHQEAQNT